jgi:hypothetical protein
MLKHYQKVLEESLVNSVSKWDAELAMPIDIDEARKRISAAVEERKSRVMTNLLLIGFGGVHRFRRTSRSVTR